MATYFFRGLRTSTGRPITDSEGLIAHSDLGVSKRHGARYTLDKQRWHETGQLREGIKSAVEMLAYEPESIHLAAKLCVSLLPMLDPASEHVIRKSSTDFRSGMVDVIAGAQQSL